MNYWYQNLNESGRQLFHFRGSVSNNNHKKLIRYEFSSGPSLKLKYTHGNNDDEASMICLGLMFFTVYLSFSLPDALYFKRKCVATWDNNKEFYLIDGREYGFYFYQWAFVWSWHHKLNESSSTDPWWMKQYIRLDDLILGQKERLENKLTEISDVYFKIGNKEFKMDFISWEKNRTFRRHIPYSLFHRTWYSVKMDIKDPPQYSGKGENSWDCGDDGTYGISGQWTKNIPNWSNREESAKLAIEYYIESVMKSAKRYGGSSSERGIRKDLPWEYIGRKQVSDGSSNDAPLI